MTIFLFFLGFALAGAMNSNKKRKISGAEHRKLKQQKLLTSNASSCQSIKSFIAVTNRNLSGTSVSAKTQDTSVDWQDNGAPLTSDSGCPSPPPSNDAAHQQKASSSPTVDAAATNQLSICTSTSVDGSVPCSLPLSDSSKEHLALDIEPPQGVPKK